MPSCCYFCRFIFVAIMLRSIINVTGLHRDTSAIISHIRNYAVAKRKLIRKEYFVYTPKMKSRYKGNPNPRLKLILLEDVERIGLKGDLVEVKRGTGRLQLIPNKLAVYATEENMNKYGIDLSKLQETPSSKVPQNVLKYLKKHTIKLLTPYLSEIHQNTRNDWIITRHDIAEYFFRHSRLCVPVDCMSIDGSNEDIIREAGEYVVQVSINNAVVVPVPLIVEQRLVEEKED